MMTCDQPPQTIPVHDGDRHAGPDSHVPQVFQVDRRDGTQRGEREVQRSARVFPRGPAKADSIGRDIGNRANPVELIQPPRGDWDIGGRVVQPQKRFLVLHLRFGNHAAMSPFQELIEHHAIEAGEAADLVDHRLISVLNRLILNIDKQSANKVRRLRRVFVRRFKLQNGVAVAMMGCDETRAGRHLHRPRFGSIPFAAVEDKGKGFQATSW